MSCLCFPDRPGIGLLLILLTLPVLASPPPSGAPARAAPPAWPLTPAGGPSIEENLAAMPAWWRTADTGIVPPSSRNAQSIYLDFFDAPDSAPSGVLACSFYGSKVAREGGESVVALTLTKRAQRLVFADKGTVVLISGVDPAQVRKVEALHSYAQHFGVVDTIFMSMSVVAVPSLILDEGKSIRGAAVLQPKGMPPWDVQAPEMQAKCRFVPPTVLEKRIAYALRDAPYCMQSSAKGEGLFRGNPTVNCLGDVVTLLGWADPRAQQMRRRYEESIAEIKQSRQAAHAAALAALPGGPQRFGDLVIERATLLRRPQAKDGPPWSIQIAGQVSGPVRVYPVPSTWQKQSPPAVDAAGQRFVVELESQAFKTVAAGAKLQMAGKLWGNRMFSGQPVPPLLVEVPRLDPWTVLVPGAPTRIADLELEIETVSLRCEQKKGKRTRLVQGACGSAISGHGRWSRAS